MTQTPGNRGDIPGNNTDDIPDDDHVSSRAELLPEEVAAGSDDPQEQARVILEESQERTEDPAGTGAEAEQTSTPDERP